MELKERVILNTDKSGCPSIEKETLDLKTDFEKLILEIQVSNPTKLFSLFFKIQLDSISNPFDQWNSASLCSTNISIQGAALKRSTETFFMAKIMSINTVFLAGNSL
jgi:hypothetical protein